MILVTGATGFVGQNLVNSLLRGNRQVRACVRRQQKDYLESPLLEPVLVEDLSEVGMASVCSKFTSVGVGRRISSGDECK